MTWSQCPEVGIAEVGGGTRLAVTQEEEKPGRVWTRGVHLATSLVSTSILLRQWLPPSLPPFPSGMIREPQLEAYSAPRTKLLGQVHHKHVLL